MDAQGTERANRSNIRLPDSSQSGATGLFFICQHAMRLQPQMRDVEAHGEHSQSARPASRPRCSRARQSKP
jgi:hypothetical protein